jgi:acyl-CoA reductase-like NAD-dependent aldehyde dehydrogenase
MRRIINPATAETNGMLSAGSPADAELAMAAGSAAFAAHAATSLDGRITLLERIARIYERRLDDIAKAITLEMGAPLSGLSLAAQAPTRLAHLKSASTSPAIRGSTWSRSRAPHALARPSRGRQLNHARSVGSCLRVGMARLNGAGMRPTAPFGGYKQS